MVKRYEGSCKKAPKDYPQCWNCKLVQLKEKTDLQQSGDAPEGTPKKV